jgi:UPF0755 protein
LNPQLEQRGNLSTGLLAVLGGTLLFIVVTAYFFYSLQPVELKGHPSAGVTEVEKTVLFKIEKGQGVREIGDSLSEQSLIKSLGVFKFYSLVSGRAQKFLPGVYELSTGMSTPEIVSMLTTPGANEIQVTIPEGSTAKDAAEILAEAGVWKKGTPFGAPSKELQAEYPFLTNAGSYEGFIFPDTYRIALDAPPETIVRMFLDNFQIKAWSLLEGKQNWYQTLTLASILEREVPVYQDRQMVAAILLRRTRIKMPLQVDATVSYAKCGGLIKTCGSLNITKGDTVLNSPYNTYSRVGWPPTPISNPGAAAIKAALAPKDNPYLYYLSAKTGETMYSKTLEEHNSKRAKYL